MAKLYVGVISEAHKRPDLHTQALTHLKSLGVEHIIHAGDFSQEQNVKDLDALGLSYTAVFGNNDAKLAALGQHYNIYPEPHYFKLKDTTFKLMHLPFYLTGDVRVVISGHTHEFSCEKKGRTLFLNPGEVCARNKPVSEYATLTVQEGRYKVVHYSKDLQTKKLHTKEFEYEQ